MRPLLPYIVIVFALVRSVAANVDAAMNQGPSQGLGPYSGYSDVVKELGLNAALLIAIRYLAIKGEKKEAEMWERERVYHETIQAKDKAINDILMSVVKANTESLARAEKRQDDVAGMMDRVADRLGDFTAAIQQMPSNCAAVRGLPAHQESVPGFIRNTPP